MNDASPRTFRAFEAATGEALEPEFPVSTTADVAAACEAAAAAFDTYRELPAERRAAVLRVRKQESRLAVERVQPFADRAVCKTLLPQEFVEARLKIGDLLEPDTMDLLRPEHRRRIVSKSPGVEFLAAR